MRRFGVLLLLAGLLAGLLPVQGARAQPLSIGPAQLGPPGSGAVAELHLPDGPGPFPAVVLLHGCSGITPNMARWAARLTR
ncbi:hypothetical protein J8J14_07520 [Roseomonas sp. SSH11]|uniref:Uncharacterized protein n=1 Tax=Pararoseomonas baculiformis TaxID=2820812 RepID=A0ABS4AC92_9PROT|nr:hypothetical protein [Pararoseomonas baculiformis]MBP0444629.1 hypothetical protein [Pararoseomonas baculiformis]